MSFIFILCFAINLEIYLSETEVKYKKQHLKLFKSVPSLKQPFEEYINSLSQEEKIDLFIRIKSKIFLNKSLKEKEKDIFDKIMALPGLNIFEGFYQKYKEMLLYLFFGGMTAVISIGSYSYCDVGLGFDPLIANIISWILAVTFAYVTNKVWVFSVETHGMHELFIEAFHFFTGRLFTLIVEEAILLIFISKLHFNSIVVKVVAQVVVVVLNYIISKLIVFREKE